MFLFPLTMLPFHQEVEKPAAKIRTGLLVLPYGKCQYCCLPAKVAPVGQDNTGETYPVTHHRDGERPKCLNRGPASQAHWLNSWPAASKTAV